MQPIDFQPLRLVSATASVAPTGQVRPEGAAPKTVVDVEVSLSALLGTQAPPIDHERVVQLRTAIENGTYNLAPAKVADAMIATFQHPADGQ
ncbi:MAG TPA: flagellar biosynthesis anti-sigma factor FlgM [Croceibacterium sp.]|nr:flagellar biosynthesis anti-sigma factor FlgM [Croceibacterium sp.]